MPKIIFNGKRKIYLSQVWFITNNIITHNAKEKIIEYFQKQNIVFIDCNILNNLLDKHYPEYWHEMTYNVANYVSKVRAKIEEEDRRYTLLPNLDPEFYIEPDIIRINKKKYEYNSKDRKNIIEKINIKESIEKEKFIVLEAQMGYGKSKLIRQLVKYYTDPVIYEEKKIFVIPTKYSALFNEGAFTPDKLIESCGICKDELNHHKKIIFLIDGFDEVQESIGEKLENVKALETYIYNTTNFSILLATRGLKGFTDLEIKHGNIKKYEIKSLTLKKIIIFLQLLCKQQNLKDRIIEDIKKSPLIKELLQSPIAAILLARLFESNAKDLPSNLPELYSMYLELILGKWDIDKGIESLKEYEIVQNILYLISYYYIDNQCDYMTIDEYHKIIDNYISSRNMENISYNKIDEIITNRAGLLIKENIRNVVYYSHRTFIEFMYAKGKEKNMGLSIDNRVYNISWMNIYYFYVGIKKDCQEILESITNIIPDNEPEKWLKIINLSNFYLAAITTPYDFVKCNLYKIIVEAAVLYKSIVKEGKTSIFSSLPQLYILWWIQLLIKENYSYEYFKNAIIDTALIIDDSSNDLDIKIYSLFFIGTVGLRLKIYEPFHFLLSKYKGQLPPDITIGIQNEIRIEKVNDKTILSIQKWIEKNIRKMHNDLLKQIKSQPIK